MTRSGRDPLVRRLGTVGHRGLERRRIVTVGGLPVVAPEHSWCDLASLLSLEDLVVVGDVLVAERTGMRTEAVFDVVRDRAGTRGAQLLRQSVGLLRRGSRSPMETRSRLVFVRGGLPEPELNADVFDELGEWLACVDFLWRAQRVIAEFDGAHHLRELGQQRRDNRLRALLRELGWRVEVLYADDILMPTRAAVMVDRLARHVGYRDDRAPAPA